MGGRRMNGCNCSATQNYVTNGFLSVYHVNHPVRSVLRAVLHGCRTCDSEQGFLAAAFSFAYSVVDVDHPVQSVLRTVIH